MPFGQYLVNEILPHHADKDLWVKVLKSHGIVTYPSSDHSYCMLDFHSGQFNGFKK